MGIMSSPVLDVAALRREYTARGLRRSELQSDPITQFKLWLNDAVAVDPTDPTAMTLSTSTPDGAPSARIVLLKAVDPRGFVFFTNYESLKGREIAANPKVALTFFWPQLERQVCVTGRAEKVPESESEIYFATRPEGSKLGAWASTQSEVIESRQWLENRLEEVTRRYAGGSPPRPPHWGGYCVTPSAIEFWQGRTNRLHDRLRYVREAAGWRIERLSP
jgi:pyridoxamine 5'-phosphate oxidase